MIPYLIASEAVYLFWTAAGVLSACATFVTLLLLVGVLVRSTNETSYHFG